MADRARTPRERYREQTRGEIKRSAVRRLAEGGVENVALLRIAKEIGLSGPALYRYFGSRDELLAELVTDAYQALADALRAVDLDGGGAPHSRRWPPPTARGHWPSRTCTC
ncbi:TetR/AcrR family transcriptional regulator [Actinomadura keratinilytica]